MEKRLVVAAIAATALVFLTPTLSCADWRDGHANGRHNGYGEQSYGGQSYGQQDYGAPGIFGRKSCPKPQFHPNGNFSHGYTPPSWVDPIREDHSWREREDNTYKTYQYGHGLGSDAIWQGYNSGRLSVREAQELREKAEEVRRQEISYRSDGRLSDRERRNLKDEYQDFYHDLSHELNDGERRW